jgi:two-component system sensor histidine kinase KdpD
MDIPPPPDSPITAPPAMPLPRWQRYGLAVLACVLTLLVALPLQPRLDLANLVVLFLLTGFLVAAKLGRGPAVLAALLGTGLFDFFLVPPHLSLAVADIQYGITLVVMLLVGLVTAHLTAQLAEQTEQALQSEQDTHRLYDVAREMAAAGSCAQVIAALDRFLASRQLSGRVVLAGPDGKSLDFTTEAQMPGSVEKTFAHSAFQSAEVVEVDTLAGSGIAIAYFPLLTPGRTFGVLAITPPTDDAAPLRASRKALEAAASLTALAIERLHFSESANAAQLQVAEERLRTSILSSLSHDLKTPLTALLGLSDALADALADALTKPGRQLPDDAAESAAIIRDQARAMNRLLTNLLDMARLQGEQPALRREWQLFEEVLGSSLRIVAMNQPGRHIDTVIEPGLPLVSFDAVLMERVLCNLLDNAIKYAASDARIWVDVARRAEWLEVSVCNEGAGFPPDRLQDVFRLFVRGSQETTLPGVGLGLAICRSIVAAHGGVIVAENLPGQACVRFTLPLGTPPAIEEESP